MKAHITRLANLVPNLPDSSTVLLTVAVNATEARRILEDLGDDPHTARSHAMQQLIEMLEVIEEGEKAINIYNALES